MRKTYPTDLSDDEWAHLKDHLPAPKVRGRPRLRDPREILNSIFSVGRSGCAWRLLAHDFPPWRTVYHYFRIWRLDGTWKRMHQALREGLRARLGRDTLPSAGIVDSQSIRIWSDRRGSSKVVSSSTTRRSSSTSPTLSGYA